MGMCFCSSARVTSVLWWMVFPWIRLAYAVISYKQAGKQTNTIPDLLPWAAHWAQSRNFSSNRWIKVWWVLPIMWTWLWNYVNCTLHRSTPKLHWVLFLDLLCNLGTNLLERAACAQTGAEVGFSFISMLLHLSWSKIHCYLLTVANSSAKCLQFWNSLKVGCHGWFLCSLITNRIRMNLLNPN